MKTTTLFAIGLFALAISCASALHTIRTIVDIADDLCVATFSDPNIDPEFAKIMAGRTAAETCKDAAVARQFTDQVKMGQKKALGALRSPSAVSP